MNKKWTLAVVLAGVMACASVLLIHAQTIPYPLTVAWDASPSTGTITYNCYLDGVQVVSGVSALTCAFPVPATGQHTIGVTANSPDYIPSESAPATLTFTLSAPGKPGNVKVR